MTAEAGWAAPAYTAGAQRVDLDTVLWLATLTWIVGMSTVFPLGNDALEAVSVFTFDRIAFLVVAALFALLVLRTPALLRRLGRVEAMVAVYLLWVLGSWLTTLDYKDAVDVKRDGNLLLNCFLMPYLAFLIARHGGWTRDRVMMSALVAAGAIGAYLVITGAIQSLFDWRFIVAQAHQEVHRSRARGPFENAILYGVTLALLLPLTVTLREYQARRSVRVGLIVLCIGIIEAVVLSRVRVVWVALPLGLFWLAARSLRLRRAAIVAGLAVLAAVGLGMAGVDATRLARPSGAARQHGASVGERALESGPIYNRVAVYATALNMIRHRPLLGWGFGAHTFTEWRDDYYASCCGVSWQWAVVCAVPHNEALNLLLLLGLVGLLIYLGVVRELWRLLSLPVADPFARDLLACGQAALLLVAMTALMHDTMYMAPVQMLLFFVIGLAGAAAERPLEVSGKAS